MDIGGWLRSLGLGQYEEQFRDNKIDADLLPRLTVDDLKDIGVSVVGDRRRLLDAIAVLAGAGPASQTKSAPSKGLQASAERRPITVMFCDLVGSTSLAAKLDAEDWRTLVNAYLDEASAAVTGLGGHVLKKLGDGLMALFGYPHAQENDAERAVRAALAIQRALSDLNARNAANGAPELSARVGIESGPVVVEASGEVFGDAPNVAARVQAAAEPGSVLITINVQRQVAGLFVAEELGARELKGVSQPVQLFRIVRASGGGRRAGARTLTPFVGREEELVLLARRWERARVGEGQLVLVVGEPGLGKSRLVEEFHAGLAETPHTWVEWSASQLLQNTPLHPIVEWGRQRFGLDAPAEQRLADLEDTLRLIGLDPVEHAPLLAPLVDVVLPPGRAANFPPEELRRRQLAAMTAWVLAGARSQPVVLAFEDLHWADPTSLDLLRAFADRGAQAPMLLLATTRPEFRAPWSLRSHHSLISLSPLDRAGVARMVGEISARHALSKELIEGVNERTGGVPLFVEEVTRLLVERGEQGGVPVIPPTLQQSLAARLDRLGPAREVAQVGAVLGRDFGYALLRDVAEIDEPALQASLERLADADLLFVEGAPPEAKYRFKHALIQDAAYESLLKSRRQALHRRAAEALQDENAEPEAIAHHFTEAGLDDLAIEWWGKAGDQALRRSAFQEAIAHLGKAIELADRDGRAVARRPTVRAAVPNLTQLHAAQGVALFAARGGGALETTEAFARARESASRDEDAPERLAADYGLWVGSYVRGELPSMRAGVRAFLSDTEARPDSPEAGVAHRAAGLTCWFAGEYREARHHLERALGLFLPGRDDDLAFRFGLDPGVAAMVNLAAVSWSLGEVDKAISLIERMQTRLAGLTHVGMLAFGKMHSALFDLMRGDHARATPKTFELASLAREHELAMYDAFGAFLHGWTTTKSGTLAAGLENMRRGVAMLREQNILLFDGLLKIALAEAEAAAGDLDRALAALGEGLATAERMGFRAFEAELHRVRGDILLQRDPGNPAPIEEAFLSAIAVAKQQGTRSFELRAALSLAKVYRATDRLAAADAVLAPAIEGFAPTPQMPEIAEAQAALAELSQTAEVKAEAEQRRRLTQLHVAYGNALIAARGYGAPETTEAFAKAREAAFGDKDAPGRLAADYGLWAGSYMRGELPEMRTHAMAFLNDLGATPDSPAASVARRLAGVTCWCAGEYREARDYFEKALALFQPGRDDDMAFRFGQDPGIAAMANLAIASWPLGEVDRAMSLIDAMETRMSGVPHIGTLSFGRMHAALFELMRGDQTRGARHAIELARLARQHELPMWGAFGVLLQGWATSASGAIGAGLDDMRQAVDSLRVQNVVLFDGLVKIALAEAEAAAGDLDRALAVLDEGLATADRVGHRAFEAELHRARGDILLKRDAASPAPTEEAFLTAIAVAKQQGTRGFELRAALALAKLYQSTARPVEAHAVLAPALEGFAPTPEMPAIAEAQALLAALADTDEVKAAEAQRRRLTQLHVSYGNALIAARGYGAPETTEAFAKAREAASGDQDAPERPAVDYGLWVSSYVRGELPSMQAHAAAFLSDVGARLESPEAGVAHRAAGMTCWFLGEYREARDHFERALALFQPGRDDDLAFRFGQDAGVAAMFSLAVASWPLGEVHRAISLIDRMQTRIAGLTHVGTLAVGRMHAALFELMRGEHARVAPNVFELVRLVREHDLPMQGAFGVFLKGWATAASGAPADGLADMRRGVELLREQNVLYFDGLLKIALAEAEARAGDAESAVAILDEALSAVDRTGSRAFEAELHRARGEIQFRRDPANPATAEDAFLTAIAVAKQQGTRSFQLRAALSLAKLYQSTGRPADAHAILAPALEGFSPTSEMPEIDEARALLDALAATDAVKAAADSRRQRVHLQTSYGKALMGVHGYGAPETALAFESARALATGLDDSVDRFPASYGVWVGTHVRGELLSMRELAATFLRESASRPNSGEASVGHRIMGATHWFAAEFVEARAHLEQAVAIFDPSRDADLAFRYGQDIGVSASAYSAIALWPLGEIDLSRRRADHAVTRARSSSHVATAAYGLALSALYRLLIRDPEGAQPIAAQLGKAAEDLQSPQYLAFHDVLGGWPAWRSGSGESALLRIRRGIAQLKGQGIRTWAPLTEAMLAEVESEAGDSDSAMVTIARTIAEAERLGQRWYDAELHRIRGEILLKQAPSVPAPAEEAFLTAIAIAQRQKARTFELRAALSLAKLYRATGRDADAHAALAPALEGFSATPEMPEIAAAQALLTTLAEMEEVKAAVAQRKRRLHLQTAYGHAMMWSTGFASEETKAAFARATELATGSDNSLDRLVAAHGQWVLATVRGELRVTRGLALTFLREAEEAGRVMEACVVHRSLALISYFSGDFAEAGSHCEQALAACEPEWDLEVLERFGDGISAVAMSFLALTAWQLGDVERARELIESANRRAAEFGHGPSMTTPLYWKSYFEILRGDASAALTAAEALEAISRDQGMSFWGVMSKLNAGWAHGRFNNPIAGAAEIQQGLTAYASHGARLATGFYTGLLAELEAETLGAESALSRIDEALALALQVDHRSDLAFLHRLRGEILLKRDPNNPASAEEAFQTALAVARQQGARSHGLKTALALAKLYQSTNRLVDAQAVLSPALEGFSPTPEMPEIAEAQALLVAIEAGGHVRHE